MEVINSCIKNFSLNFMHIKNINIYILIKLLLQIGILILFMGGFFKLFFTIPNNLILKLIFLFTYLWFTIGMNVNFMMPLISIIDKKINQIKS